MARKYFPFYFTFYETAKTMPPKTRAAFYAAIIEYGVNGTEPSLPKSISGYWPLIKPLLDTSKKRYDAGTNGGRPSKNVSFGFPDTETIGLHKEKENEKENENVREKENDKQQPTAPTAAVAPHEGAYGDSTVLDISTTTKDPATEEALRKFFDSIKQHPAGSADNAAPPSANQEV